MIRRFWNWFTCNDLNVPKYIPAVIEFDRKKSYIVSLPDCGEEDLVKFKAKWEEEMKKKKSVCIFINRPIMIRTMEE